MGQIDGHQACAKTKLGQNKVPSFLPTRTADWRYQQQPQGKGPVKLPLLVRRKRIHTMTHTIDHDLGFGFHLGEGTTPHLRTPHTILL